MKKSYISAQIEVKNFDTADVITTSFSFQDSGYGRTLEWRDIV